MIPDSDIILVQDTAFIAIGDTATFKIVVNTANIEMIGFAFLIAFSDEVFLPILYDNGDIDISGITLWEPFAEGPVLPSNASINDFYANPKTGVADTVGSADLNGLPWYQLFYGEAGPQNQSALGNDLTVATFRAKILVWPSDGSGFTTMYFDAHEANGYTRNGQPGILSSFRQLNSLQVVVSGAKIRPAIPDTVITPGTNISLELGNYLFSVYDSTQVTWSYTDLINTSGSSFGLGTASSSYQIDINTNLVDHGTITALIHLDTPNPLYFDSQVFKAYVDFAPIFDQDLDVANFTFDEDTPFTRAISTLFSDDDDSGPDITIWLEPDSLVHISYDNNEIGRASCRERV